MCGITAVFIKKKTTLNPKLLTRRMMKRLEHRGPDGKGFVQRENVVFGHQRLSIVDPKNGEQPFIDVNNRAMIIFNGQIYNYKSLKARLVNKGYIFKTGCDTEVLLLSYLEWGEEVVHKLDGMFAFAIYDFSTQKIFAARDPLGIKPFYFYEDAKVFLIASEIKAFLEYPQFKKDINFQALNEYLHLRFTFPQRTLFKFVSVLEPGSCLTFDGKKTIKKKYVNFYEHNELRMPERDTWNKFISLFSKSVEKRLQGEVPKTALLSGGLDSGLITAIMSKNIKPLSTYTIEYDEKEYSERKLAKLVSKKYSARFNLKTINVKDYFNEISSAIYYRDEPLAYPSEIPIKLIAKEVGKKYKVCLSGEGADEFLAGYDKFGYALKMKGKQDVCMTYSQLSCIFDYEQRLNLFTKRYSRQLKERGNQVVSEIDLVNRKIKTRDYLNRILALELNILLPSCLSKQDRMNMAASVESRVPFLDKELIRFIMKIPSDLKFKGNKTKYLIRKYAVNLLPAEVLDAPKKGLPTPLAQWLAKDYKVYARKILLSKRTLRRAYFKKEYLQKLLSEANPNDELWGKRVFSLINLELWFRIFVDKTK